MKSAERKSDEGEGNLSWDEVSGVYVGFSRVSALLPFEGRDYSFIGTRLLTAYLLFSSFFNWGMLFFYCFDAVDDIYLTILVVSVNYRFYAMLLKREQFAGIVDECRSLWELCDDSGRRTVLLYERKIRAVYRFFFFTCCISNVTYPLEAYLTRLPSLEPNGTLRRALPFNWFVEDEPYKFMGYHATFIWQAIVVQNAMIYGMTCDGSMSFFAMIASGYFRHLRQRLGKAHTDSHEIVSCAKFHQRLIAFCLKLQQFARTMLLTQVISTAYNISLILLKLLSSEAGKYKHLSVLGIFVCQLFLVQWAPDYLYDESEGVGLAAYSVFYQWMSRGTPCRHLLLIITRAQRPVLLKAGGFIPLTLENFGSMMTNAFSFFTVLRNLNW